MAPDVEQNRLSRRNLVRTAAASAGVAAVAGAGGAALASPGASHEQGLGPLSPLAATNAVSVAGLLVRADHAPASAGTMSIGVRTSIWHPILAAAGVVLVVDGVEFANAALVNAQIADGLRQQVGNLLTERGFPTDPEEIAVQLFGASVE
jgi:hypothetical protein